MLQGPGTSSVMDSPSHASPFLFVGAGFFAVVVHAAVLLYDNKPVSARKAAASCILTACVGGVSALLAVEYGHFTPAVVMALMLGVGGIGGWSILQILTVAGKRWMKRKAEAITGDNEGKEP